MMVEFDPNKALDTIREGIRCIRTSEDVGSWWTTYALTVVNQAEALDEWLSKGGRPPAAWDPFSKQPAPTVTGRTYIRPPATPEQHARGTD